MKRIMLFFLLGVSISGFSQVSDNFSDGDFTNNPVWSGNDESFEIDSETGMLHSINETANSKYYLSTSNAMATNCQWNFYANLQFNTSSTNYVDIFLVSDKANLSVAAGMNGYFVRLGGTADEICLYKRTNGSDAKIIDGVDGVLNKSNNILRIRVIRDENNVWTLDRDITGTGTSYFTEGTATDAAFPSTMAFGIYIVQSTASFFKKHYFTDFYVGEIIPDTEAPTVISTVVDGNNQLIVNFSEEMDLTNADFSVQNLNTSAVTIAPDKKSVTLQFAGDFTSGTVYTLKIVGATDKVGNALEKNEYQFGLTELPEVGDLILNEICFSNADGSEKYVEIYNKSSKILDVGGMRITTRKADGSLTTTLYSIPANTSMMPGAYLALCKTPNLVQMHYNTPEEANFAALSSFPSLNSTGATVMLADASLQSIFDELTYSSKWHDPLIKTPKGVALERINPNQPTQDASNWHSAASDVNYGTPGYKNSQYRDVSVQGSSEKELWIDKENFSPNNDGYEDILLISYRLPENGYMADITIFDASGHKIRKLYDSYLLGTEGTLTWDGSDDQHRTANIGIYVIYVKLYNATLGKTKQYKLVAVVSEKK